MCCLESKHVGRVMIYVFWMNWNLDLFDLVFNPFFFFDTCFVPRFLLRWVRNGWLFSFNARCTNCEKKEVDGFGGTSLNSLSLSPVLQNGENVTSLYAKVFMFHHAPTLAKSRSIRYRMAQSLVKAEVWSWRADKMSLLGRHCLCFLIALCLSTEICVTYFSRWGGSRRVGLWDSPVTRLGRRSWILEGVTITST